MATTRRIRGNRARLLVGATRPAARGRATLDAAELCAQVGVSRAGGRADAVPDSTGVGAQVGRVVPTGGARANVAGATARTIVVFKRRWLRRGRMTVAVGASAVLGRD